ncbi:HU family DNA-binding protein [Metamycoplasma spumans]|uniref:HU family DNA-binding protein n=1 Tax=Metamycoplasma spumans TaxID=92406 RepID=UPI00047F7C00
MNKKELIAQVSENTGFPQASVESTFEEIINVISQQISNGENVMITGLGTFSSKIVKARTKTNNITKETIDVSEKLDPRFKFSATYKNNLNKNFSK